MRCSPAKCRSSDGSAIEPFKTTRAENVPSACTFAERCTTVCPSISLAKFCSHEARILSGLDPNEKTGSSSPSVLVDFHERETWYNQELSFCETRSVSVGLPFVTKRATRALEISSKSFLGVRTDNQRWRLNVKPGDSLLSGTSTTVGTPAILLVASVPRTTTGANTSSLVYSLEVYCDPSNSPRSTTMTSTPRTIPQRVLRDGKRNLRLPVARVANNVPISDVIGLRVASKVRSLFQDDNDTDRSAATLAISAVISPTTMTTASCKRAYMIASPLSDSTRRPPKLLTGPTLMPEAKACVPSGFLSPTRSTVMGGPGGRLLKSSGRGVGVADGAAAGAGVGPPYSSGQLASVRGLCGLFTLIPSH
mmetsp:Transcript_56232/g.138115  ORF Transcript_56232/g.138115 Transcript_56232/m.138115 type:complete len:365 (+) Transcript_56232:1347-2441(+)